MEIWQDDEAMYIAQNYLVRSEIGSLKYAGTMHQTYIMGRWV